jgi:hypothetical protein
MLIVFQDLFPLQTHPMPRSRGMEAGNDPAGGKHGAAVLGLPDCDDALTDYSICRNTGCSALITDGQSMAI